jgi:hypothetical protein
MLSRDDILGRDDRPVTTVFVDEWGGEVCVRPMTAAERERFEQAMADDKGGNIRATLAVRCCCDAEGSPLFSDADIPLLAAKGCAALVRLYAPLLKLNRLRRSDVRELEGNS